MENKTQNVNLRDVLRILLKHRLKIFTVFFVTVMAATAMTFLAPPMYEAKSSLMINAGREYSWSPEVGEAKGPQIRFSSEEVINSEIQIIKSLDLIEKVIVALGVEYVYPELVDAASQIENPRRTAIQRFKNAFSAKPIKTSKVIEVSFRHRDPQVAVRVVNKVVEVFKEKHLQVLSPPRSSFLERQLVFYRDRLETSEKKLEAFKQEYGVFSLDEQRSILLQQRASMDSSLKGAQNRLAELEEKVSVLGSQLRKISADAARYPDTRLDEDAKQKILALQLQEKQLLGKYRPTNRLIVNIRKEIMLLEEFLAGQGRKLSGMARKESNVFYRTTKQDLINAKSELSSLRAKSAAMQGQLSALDDKIKALDFREKEYKDIKRELDSNTLNYKTYQQKFEEARISEDMDRQKVANIGVIHKAKAPLGPINSNKRLKILIGIVLGAALGVGLAFFSEYHIQALSTPESVETRLGLPVLATFPDRES